MQQPNCIRLADERDPAGRCTYHLMGARRRQGLCANCGSERERQPVLNALTGKQLKRRGEPAWEWRCCGCGRLQQVRPRGAGAEFQGP